MYVYLLPDIVLRCDITRHTLSSDVTRTNTNLHTTEKHSTESQTELVLTWKEARMNNKSRVGLRTLPVSESGTAKILRFCLLFKGLPRCLLDCVHVCMCACNVKEGSSGYKI